MIQCALAHISHNVSTEKWEMWRRGATKKKQQTTYSLELHSLMALFSANVHLFHCYLFMFNECVAPVFTLPNDTEQDKKF